MNAPTAEATLETPTPAEEAARPARWELAECNCPDFCERDHEQD
jgi:hypothetical protein